MSARDGLIVTLPEAGEPLWMRVVDGVVVKTGAGTNWLAACGLTSLPDDGLVMLVPPAALTVLHWVAYPDLPARQGRAAARLAALSGGAVPADGLFAAVGDNDDPARAHIVAVAARADMQHWLLWAQHHGLDPDIIVPAAMLLPEPESDYVRGMVGGIAVVRGADVALPADMAATLLPADAVVREVPAGEIDRIAMAALNNPPLDMRRGDFAKRVRRTVDRGALTRLAVWIGCILLVSLLIALVTIVRQNVMARNLDADSVALARQVVPDAVDATQARAAIDARLAARGVGGFGFTGPSAALFTAMQGAPGVSITSLARDPDGMLRVTLASAKADEINAVLVALQGAGFTVTATSSQDPGGRVLADITVRS